MERLLKFVELAGREPFLPSEDLELGPEVGRIAESVIQRQMFKNKRESYDSWNRVGALGQPRVCTAWEKFYPVEKPPITFELNSRFLFGNLWEVEAYYWLRRLGYQVEMNTEVSLCNGLVQGHPDFLCTDPNTKERFVVETKHCGETTFKSYKKSGMTNQQYLTQLSLYCYSMKCNGVWFIRNASTGEMLCIPLTEDYMPIDNVLQTITFVANLHAAASFEEVLTQYPPPSPVQRKDGSYYLPPSMYISKGVLHPACSLYDYHYDEQGRVIVTGYNYPPSIKEYEPTL